MSTKTKTLAKSLHTVSALVAMARYVLANNKLAAHMSRIEAVETAAQLLGYPGTSESDPYGLMRIAADKLR